MAIRKSRPVARALYVTRAQGEHELSFSSGEAILLLRRVDENWLEGELDGKVGIFPANRVRVEIGFPSLPHESDIARSGTPFGVALYSFAGDHPGDLRLEKGEMVELLESVGGGWTLGKIEDRTGIFPNSFVEVFQALPTSVTPKPEPLPRKRNLTETSEDKPKPKPRPRTRRLTDPAGQVAELPATSLDTKQPQSCPVSSRTDSTVSFCSRRDVHLANTCRRVSEMGSEKRFLSVMCHAFRNYHPLRISFCSIATVADTIGYTSV